MRSESEIISREYEINNELGKAVVVVSLLPSVGREKVITIRTNDVRSWLENQENIKLGEAVQGGAFNNNMTRRLGNNKTIDDLKMTYVFEIIKEEQKPVEVAVEPVAVKEKPAPKKTRRTRTTSASKSTSSSTSAKTSASEPTEAKKTTTRRRTRKKTTTKTEIVKGDQ